jgi:hypothetical protein
MRETVRELCRPIDALLECYDNLRKSLNDWPHYDMYFKVRAASDLTLDKIYAALEHLGNQE